MRTVEETPLATRLNKMYAAGIRRGEINRRLSFWTNDESDDQVAANEKNGKARPSPLFTAISPEAPDLALDLIDHPRKYVTLLLGGGTNLWSNIDFAGAFATCVRGKPIVVHATRVSSSGQTEPDNQGIREAFPDIAPQLHPGLRAVVLDPGGTANTGLAQTGALALIRSLPRVDVLAKTGTLARRGASGHTSRILLALVRWNPSRTDAERGVVFSLVGRFHGAERRRDTAPSFRVSPRPPGFCYHDPSPRPSRRAGERKCVPSFGVWRWRRVRPAWLRPRTAR
jgi:hypothetical protein